MFNKQNMQFKIWCLLGLTLSVYATYVEIKSEQDKNYTAYCDLSETISCTKVFSSRFGKGFGISGLFIGDDSKWNPPNGVLGIIFYNLILFMSTSKSHLVSLVQLLLCAASNIMSFYLAYLLYFVLEDLCLVCVSIYFVNIFCTVECWGNYKRMWIDQSQTNNLNKAD